MLSDCVMACGEMSGYATLTRPTTKKQKIELIWIGKENQPKLESRIYLEDPEKSYHAKHRVTEGDIFDSQLIFGDEALWLTQKQLAELYHRKFRIVSQVSERCSINSAFHGVRS